MLDHDRAQLIINLHYLAIVTNPLAKTPAKLIESVKNWAIALSILLIYGWAWQGLNVQIADLQNSIPNAIDFIGRLFPPDLQILDVAVIKLVETIQMSLWGTTIGAILSLPIAIFSASNLAPLWLQLLTNGVQSVIRSIPSLVLGLFFVSATGLGAPAGTLALAIYTIGYLGKFYQTALESVEPRSLEALRLGGANWAQVARYGVMPQVLPLLWGYTIYMFEYNIRAASILGVVGAGGIGFELVNYMRGFEYQKATTMGLVLLAIVIAIDLLSNKLRQRLESR
jgi:phosphonate transport system permease protein